MKQPWEWTEEDVLGLIRDKVKESITLDYKGCGGLEKKDSKKTEISKDVSAFANSAGGSIIYGVSEDGHLPTGIDGGYDPEDITKEWLEQVISTTIQRRIDGIRINQIELAQTHPGKVIYLVYVPQSNRAPHMAGDKRFYKRHNFESRPMEEYEVRDVGRRSDAPDLQLAYKLEVAEFTEVSCRVYIYFSITNESLKPAEYSLITLHISERASIIQHSGFEKADPSEVKIGSEVHHFQAIGRKLAVPNSMPIWKGVAFSLSSTPITIELPQIDTYDIGWQLDSPGMPTKTQFYQLVWQGGSAVLMLPIGQIGFTNSQ